MPRLLRLTLSVAALLFLAPAVSAASSPIAVPGFHGLRIPPGGAAQGKAPGGRGKIVIYMYQTPNAALATAMRKLLATDGWKITKDTTSPRGSVRMSATRKGHEVHISVAGMGGKAALILRRN